MKNSNIVKINKLGKAGYIICKIGKIALIIAAVICLICGVLMSFVPKSAVEIELETANSAIIHLDDSLDYLSILDMEIDSGLLEIGENTYKITMADEEEPLVVKNSFHLSDIKWILFAGVVVCAAAYIALHFACGLCAYFKSCESPFSEESAKGLVRLAWSLIPICILSSMVGSSASFLIGGDISVGIDLATVLLILCVFMLSYIFKHGAALQAEADETL